MSAAADGDFDLRDENNQPIRNPAVQRDLRQAEVTQQFEALFAAALPKAAVVQDALKRVRQLFLDLAAPMFPIFGFFDALTPPVRPDSHPIDAGAFSSFAPALFVLLGACSLSASDRTRSIPLVLRC